VVVQPGQERGAERVARADRIDDFHLWRGHQQPHIAVRTVRALGAKSDIILTLPRDAHGKLKATAVFDGPLAAPVAAGQQVGMLRLEAPGMTPMEVPLVTTAPVEKLGAFGRMIAAAKYLIRS